MCDEWVEFVVSELAETHECDRSRDGRPEGLSSGTSKWSGRTLVHHPVCDPTTPAAAAAGGLCLDQWFEPQNTVQQFCFYTQMDCQL